MKIEKYFSLSQIGLHNPQRMSDELVEKLFVVRNKEFDFLINRVKKEQPNSIPQHHLIIAQRGMGKSTLLKRIEVELRKNSFKEIFIPLIFPEEQYNLKNLSEFWLNSLDAFADTLETEKQSELVRKIDKKIDVLAKIKDEEERSQEAFQYLQTVTTTLKRRPVLLIDNMNFIFNRLHKADQHKLRAWLMQKNAPILIGASAVAIDEINDYGAPFYDAFQISLLSKLKFEDLTEVLCNLARLTNSKNIIPEIRQKQGRLKTIHQLTGGSPRTTTILFKLVVNGFSKEINDDLEALLDEITPLYKARFEELSTQMQVIVDAIALHWDPINLQQLREATRLENSQLSPQLKRLLEVGWIESLDAYQAKGKAYQISERFFNIWFLMRRSSRRQKRELYCLSKFLESFYGDELIHIAKNRVGITSNNVKQITYDLALAMAVKDRKIKTKLENKSYAKLREMAKIDPKLKEIFDIPEEIKDSIEDQRIYFLNKEKELLEKIKEENDNAELWYQLGFLYDENLKEFTKAEEAYLRATEIAPKYSDPWNNLGNLYQNHLRQFIKAKEAYLKAIEIAPKYSAPWNNLGHLYQYHLKQFNNAKEAYLKAIEFDPNSLHPWNNLGNLYQNLKKFNNAEEAYLKAIEIDPKYSTPWYGLGYLYQINLKQFKKAEKAYLKAIEFAPKDSVPWNELGNLYKNHLKQFNNAEEAYLKAIEIDPNFSYPWNGLGHLYQDHLKQFNNAKEAYFKAIKIDPKYSAPWNNLGNLYQINLKQFKKAEEAYLKAIEVDPKDSAPWYGLGYLYQINLQQFKKAEKAYLKAIEFDPKDSAPWNELGNLYKNHLKQFNNAEEAYLKAIEIDPNFSYPWNGLGNLYQDHLKQFNNAKEAYFKAIKIDPKYSAPWNNLGNLYHINLKQFKKAEEAYLKAIEVDPKDSAPWYGLGYLYQNHLKKFSNAEEAYLKAIEIAPKDFAPWHTLGNLYHDHLKKFNNAEEAYLKAIEVDPKDSDTWHNLGHLYQYHLKEFIKAKEAYLKAIEIDPKDLSPWNNLGNLYQDHLKQFTKAEEAYLKAIEIDPQNVYPKYNLVFLYRDQLNQLDKAKKLFDTIEPSNEVLDSYWLNKTLFELYQRNEGIGTEYFDKALSTIDKELPHDTQDDWWRFGAIVTKLGYTEWLLDNLKKQGYDSILIPYYVAIQAMGKKDSEKFLNSKAVEIREPAKLIIERMNKYL